MNQEASEKQKADEWAQFERVCRPVVEFIKKYYGTPHHRVLIDWNSAELIQTQKKEDFKMWIDEEQRYRYKIPAAEVLAERLLRYRGSVPKDEANAPVSPHNRL